MLGMSECICKLSIVISFNPHYDDYAADDDGVARNCGDVERRIIFYLIKLIFIIF